MTTDESPVEGETALARLRRRAEERAAEAKSRLEALQAARGTILLPPVVPPRLPPVVPPRPRIDVADLKESRPTLPVLPPPLPPPSLPPLPVPAAPVEVLVPLPPPEAPAPPPFTAEPREPQPTRAGSGTGRKVIVLLLALLLVAGLTVGVVFLLKGRHLDQRSDRREAARTAAANAVRQINTFDYRKPDDWQRRAQAVSTGALRAGYPAQRVSRAAAAASEQLVTTTTVSRVSAEIDARDGSVANCLVSADVLTRTKKAPGGKTDRQRLSVRMQLVKGTWLATSAEPVPVSG